MMRKGQRREFSVVVERGEEGYFLASVPALEGCLSRGVHLERGAASAVRYKARALQRLWKSEKLVLDLCTEVHLAGL